MVREEVRCQLSAAACPVYRSEIKYAFSFYTTYSLCFLGSFCSCRGILDVMWYCMRMTSMYMVERCEHIGCESASTVKALCTVNVLEVSSCVQCQLMENVELLVLFVVRYSRTSDLVVAR